MANLNITYAEMSETARRMRNNKDEIDTRLADCKSIVLNLVSSGFVTDEASGRFDAVHQDFDKAAGEVMESLNQLSVWLDKAVDALRQVDTELANSLRK